MRTSLVVLCIILLCANLNAQEFDDDSEYLFDQIEQTDDEVNIIDEEMIGEFADKPLDINTVDENELLKIPGMNAQIVQEIVQRRALQPYTNITQIKSLNGITPEQYVIFRKCLCIKKGKNASVQITERLGKELQEKQGFTNGNYMGNPYATQTRITGYLPLPSSSSKQILSDIRFGCAMKKDAGEYFRYGILKGFTEFSIPSLSTAVLVGDYCVHAGEGIIFGVPSFVTSAPTITSLQLVRKTGALSRLSTSAEWNLRGLALTFQKYRINATALYSNQFYHGSINNDSVYSTFDKSGYFRTSNDLKKRNALNEHLIGLVIETKPMDSFAVGGAFYHSKYNRAIAVPTRMLDTVNSIWCYSVYTRIQSSSFNVSVESGFDYHRRCALCGRMLFQPDEATTMMLMMRKYPEYFLTLHGNAIISSGNEVRNESGVTIGVFRKFNEKLSTQLLYDQYRNKEKNFLSLSQGQLFNMQILYQMNANYELNFRFRFREGDVMAKVIDSYGREIAVQCVHRIENYRVKFIYRPLRGWALKSNIDYVTSHSTESNGTANGINVSQGLQCSPFPFLSFETCVNVFETDSYESRLYSYESNLPGYSTSALLYGEGVRWYMIINVHPTKKISFHCKYTQNAKDGVTSYGSGNETVNGSVRSSILMQLKCAF